jgi:hypothetical protein
MKSGDCRFTIITLVAIVMVLFTGLIVLAGMASEGPASGPNTEQYEIQRALFQAEGGINGDLQEMDSRVSDGAARIGSFGLNGTETKKTLEYMGNYPWAVDTITVDTKGVIVTVEPETYASVIGEDLNTQKHLKRLYSQKVPVMSDLFLSVEGDYAVDIASPVFAPEGNFTGATTLLFNPEQIILKNTPKMANGDPRHLMVMQKDGTIVYEPDTGQVGKNAFTDPIFQPYPELVSLAGNMSRERVGSGTYTFTDTLGMNVTKEIFWTTVGIRGTEWRLAIIMEPGPQKL